MNEQYENGPFGFLSFSDEGLITHVNQTACNVLKYEFQQLLETSVENIFTLPTKIFYQTHFYPLVKLRGRADEIFISLRSSTGEHIPVLLNATFRENGDDKIISCAFIIVHQRKKFEDELVAARETAERALNENITLQQMTRKLEEHSAKLDRQIQLVKKQNDELQQFHHVITHSLREPVRKMLLFGSIVKDETSSESLNKMLASADQVKSVVSALQQYIWLNEKPNDFRTINLSDVVKGAQAQLVTEGFGNILRVQYNDLPSIRADFEQLQVLFYHLMHNAVRFRRNDVSNVTVNAVLSKQNVFRHVEGKYRYVDFARIEIVDDGMGFDPVYAKEIFGLFRKLQRSEGQGLGLALCRKIAENHGGDIAADSQVNSFTKIILHLPVQQYE